ncbi:MAG: bifunctional riboflavin kinase/FAD synthetase [Candidatus Brocadiia bacterium]
MQVVRWPEERPHPEARSVVTLGVFDGVHRGHAEVIRRAVAAAQARAATPTLVTFDRDPTAVLRHTAQPAITSLEHKLRLFERMGVRLCVVVQFTAEVARIPAEDFVRRLLHGALRAELVVVGEDCRFGHRRRGDVSMLRRLGRELGFEVQSVQPVRVGGEPVSSTAIRQAVREGQIELASRLLGRPFSLYGTVVPGEGLGKALGFPTANLDLHNETVPPAGVYACRVFRDGQPLPAIVSVGTQPTLHPEREGETVVEAHLLDYEGDLYGQDLEVQFVGHIREQQVFAGREELRAQIARDVQAARAMLSEG